MTVTVDPDTGIVAWDGIPWPRLVATERDKVLAQLDWIERFPNPPEDAAHWDDLVAQINFIIEWAHEALSDIRWAEIQSEVIDVRHDLRAWGDFIKQATKETS